MRCIAIASLAVLAAIAVSAAPADAAKRKQYVNAVTMQPERAEAGVVVRRSRTRITVTRRSYLDAGTEVFPGSMSYRDYVFQPNDRMASDYYLPSMSANQFQLPYPWWLGSYHAPSWGY